MTKDKELIEFISTFEMYRKEESGIKPNTIRILTFEKEQRLRKATHIKIRKGYTKEFFIRKITDKTKWDVQWIISWNPNIKALTSLTKALKKQQTNDKAFLCPSGKIEELKKEYNQQEKLWIIDYTQLAKSKNAEIYKLKSQLQKAEKDKDWAFTQIKLRKQQLQTQRNDMFKEIEEFIKKFDIEYKVMLDSEKWQEFKQHLKQKHKGDD